MLKRKSRSGNFLQKPNANMMHHARVAQVQAHPIGGGKRCVASVVLSIERKRRVRDADAVSGSRVLGFPSKCVVVPAVTKMQKTSDGHERVQGGIKLLLNRDRKDCVFDRPDVVLFNGR